MSIISQFKKRASIEKCLLSSEDRDFPGEVICKLGLENKSGFTSRQNWDEHSRYNVYRISEVRNSKVSSVQLK